MDKNKENEEFDVTMGSNDGADTREIEGLFLLYIIGNNNIALNRDDGLASFTNNNSH